jgi:hypothetical protein
MTSARRRSAFFGGLTTAILFAAWRVYSRRALGRVVSMGHLFQSPLVAWWSVGCASDFVLVGNRLGSRHVGTVTGCRLAS